MLTVKNNGEDHFSAKFDGVQYAFPTGETVIIPIDAARHIFGVGQADKTTILARHGWLVHSAGVQAAMDKLGTFAFGMHTAEPVVPDDILEFFTAPVIEQGSAPLLTGTGDVLDSDGSGTPPAHGNKRGRPPNMRAA